MHCGIQYDGFPCFQTLIACENGCPSLLLAWVVRTGSKGLRPGVKKEGRFHRLKPWWHLYFTSKYNLLKCPNENKFKVHWILPSEESKIKRATRHLQLLLQLQSRKHGSFKNRGKKSTNGSTLTNKKTKCFAFPNGKKHALLWGLEQITFKPIAYRHTRSMRPVKDMLWADRSQTCKRETKGGKTLANIACCIEQT